MDLKVKAGLVSTAGFMWWTKLTPKLIYDVVSAVLKDAWLLRRMWHDRGEVADMLISGQYNFEGRLWLARMKHGAACELYYQMSPSEILTELTPSRLKKAQQYKWRAYAHQISEMNPEAVGEAYRVDWSASWFTRARLLRRKAGLIMVICRQPDYFRVDNGLLVKLALFRTIGEYELEDLAELLPQDGRQLIGE